MILQIALVIFQYIVNSNVQATTPIKRYNSNYATRHPGGRTHKAIHFVASDDDELKRLSEMIDELRN